jgi:GPH family glycoside/pentoside/hexuronide:cation symporter
MQTKKLTVKQKLGFGIFDLGGNLLFTVMGFWCLNYLTDTVGLAASLAGVALMVGKIWDAVTDPAMGFITDRTITRLGRRRPYILAGAIPMGLALWAFFTAPSFTSQTALAVWATVVLMLCNTFSTIINVPYASLTPELTDDYHEQTSLNGYRFGCAVFGTLIGAAAVQPLVGLFGGGRHGFSMTGLVLGAVITIVTLLTFFGTKEKPHTKADLPKEGFFTTYRAVFSNKPYVILILTYMLHLVALTLLQGIIVYYTKYIYFDEGMATPAMAMLLVVAMVFIPVSVVVSKHIGKKLTYQICFITLAVATLSLFFLGHILGKPFFYGIMVLAGIGVGFNYVAPFAMVPDTILYDEVKTGSRKEGAYYGMWTFFSKIGASAAALFSGLILTLGRYVPNAVNQSPEALLAIRFIIGPIPCLVFIAATILVKFYPLDEKAYQELMAEKARRGHDSNDV